MAQHDDEIQRMLDEAAKKCPLGENTPDPPGENGSTEKLPATLDEGQEMGISMIADSSSFVLIAMKRDEGDEDGALMGLGVYINPHDMGIGLDHKRESPEFQKIRDGMMIALLERLCLGAPIQTINACFNMLADKSPHFKALLASGILQDILAGPRDEDEDEDEDGKANGR